MVNLDGGPQPGRRAHQLVELLVRLVVVGPVRGFGHVMGQPVELIQLFGSGIDGRVVRHSTFEQQPPVHQAVHCLGFGR